MCHCHKLGQELKPNQSTKLSCCSFLPLICPILTFYQLPLHYVSCFVVNTSFHIIVSCFCILLLTIFHIIVHKSSSCVLLLLNFFHTMPYYCWHIFTLQATTNSKTPYNGKMCKNKWNCFNGNFKRIYDYHKGNGNNTSH